ncbi:hypothetical protein BG452_02985 [Streptomyces sp. CBMA123]|nr:hypothetical protein [Streptomyces sp. CBMA123]
MFNEPHQQQTAGQRAPRRGHQPNEDVVLVLGGSRLRAVPGRAESMGEPEPREPADNFLPPDR